VQSATADPFVTYGARCKESDKGGADSTAASRQAAARTLLYWGGNKVHNIYSSLFTISGSKYLKKTKNINMAMFVSLHLQLALRTPVTTPACFLCSSHCVL